MQRKKSKAMDEILGQYFEVGEHGFVRPVDYLGNDSSIVQAARVSYGEGTKTYRGDRALIRYLLRHQHTSPFEFVEIVLHARAPMFIARQWYRHRTASINEVSGRYSVLEPSYFYPKQLNAQPVNSKQGRAKESVENETELLEVFANSINQSDAAYRKLTDSGVAREIARAALPAAVHAEWYWKIDLHNLLRFLRLRLHHTAQLELRAYAARILEILASWLPITYEAFCDYQLNNTVLSAQALKCLKLHIQGEELEQESSGLSPGEWREFQAFLRSLKES